MGAAATRRALAAMGWLVLLVGGGGCSEDRGPVREWTPADHSNNERPTGQVAGTAAPGQENATLVAVTWRQNCAVCHGGTGRGDGPQGRMLRVPSLARAEFQRGNTDAQIAAVIRNGRNKMPAFGHLPPNVVEGLVGYIRAFGGRR
ncbi:MAG: cytochrome c [Myxococcota bacterium]